MKVGTLFFVLRDVVNKLESMGLLTVDGDLVTPSPEQDVMIAAFVESSLKGHGVDVPERVDKIVQLLPVVFALVK